MKKIYFTFFLLLYFQVSLACECNVISADQETNKRYFLERDFKESTIIFFGTYLGERKFEMTDIHRGKEILSNTQIMNQDEENMCDYKFVKGKKYLVFGFLNDDKN